MILNRFLQLQRFCLLVFILSTCNEPTMSTQHSLDIQGHRGCRGLMPENTIPAFLKAIDIGVNTLEMDVVITKDNQVVVSHDPFLSHEMCLDPEGKEILEEEEMNWNIYEMTYEELKACDCGTKTHTRFPDQEKMEVHKPLLSEVIIAAEAYAKEKGHDPLWYNIETKTQPQRDNIYHPEPKPFTDLLLEVIDKNGITQRTTIQSFDVRTLQVIRQSRPEVKLVLLVENEDTPEQNLEKLGFTPEVYSPYFELIDDHLISFCKEKNMQLIPWTVNEKEDIRKVLDMGVDGIISDYPDRVVEMVSKNNQE